MALVQAQPSPSLRARSQVTNQAKPSQARPGQAKPSQAKPSRAKPSQAKPSHKPIQAKPSQAKPSQVTSQIAPTPRSQGLSLGPHVTVAIPLPCAVPHSATVPLRTESPSPSELSHRRLRRRGRRRRGACTCSRPLCRTCPPNLVTVAFGAEGGEGEGLVHVAVPFVELALRT